MVKFFLVVTFLLGVGLGLVRLVFRVRFGVWFVQSSNNQQHFDLTQLDHVFVLLLL